MLQTALPIVAPPPHGCPEPAGPPSSEPAPAEGGGFAKALRDAGAPDANTEPVRADGGDDAQRKATRPHDGATPEQTAIERRQAATRGPSAARRDGAARPGDTPAAPPDAEAAADAAGQTAAAAAAAARAHVDRREAATPAEEDGPLRSDAAVDALPPPMAEPPPSATAPAIARTPLQQDAAAQGAALADGETPVRRRTPDTGVARSGGRSAQGAQALRTRPEGIAQRDEPVNTRPVGTDTAAESRTETALPTMPRELVARANRESLDMSSVAPLAATVARFDGSNAATRVAAGMQATLDPPVGSREFAPALGAQVAVWVRDGVQEARLQLHPAELGPLAIQIALDGHAAQIDFHAAHALTRDAIEASLPALAASLRESGFTLTGGGVFGQGAGGAAGERDAAPQRDGRQPAHEAGEPTAGATLAEPRGRGWRRGLLDVFA